MIAREETRCRHMGYSFRLAARVILYASPHRQDNTYHGLCYTSRGALAGTRDIYIDIVIHQYIYIHTHIYIHTYIHTCMHAYIQ